MTGVVIDGSTFEVMRCHHDDRRCIISSHAGGDDWTTDLLLQQPSLQRGKSSANEIFYLAVSPDTPWANVVRAAEEIGRHRVAFLFRKKRTSTEPSNFQPGIANADWPERGRLILKQFPDCPAAGKIVLDSMGDVPPETLVSELPKAIRSCDCRADISRVESLLWERYGRKGAPTYSTLEIENVRDPGLTDPNPEVIQLPATLPWKDAVLKLSPHSGKRVLLRVADDPPEK